jgi:catechol 2,3-dioxygenase-like lactoylglutathione lyase family enzyme
MHFLGIDHLVLTVASIEKSLWFYCELLGMEQITFGIGRKAIRCGHQKINLHEIGKEFEPKAYKPTAGSADICLITDMPLDLFERDPF